MQKLKDYLTQIKKLFERKPIIIVGVEQRRELTDEILSGIGGLGAEILSQAFERIGAKPERLSIDVLMQKGDESTLYLIPSRQELYGSEEKARKNLQPGETLYRLNIYRLE